MTRSTAVPIAEDLRVRMVPLAFRVARLCSAAQVLSGLGRHLGHIGNDLLPPFESARDSVHRFHAALGRGDDVEAHDRLESLTADVERLNTLLGDLDAACTPEELGRWIEVEPTVGADALARLVEFYAHDRTPGAEVTEKLVRVTRSLMLREEVLAIEADAILAAIQRRYLLQAGGEAAAIPEPALVARFRALRARIEEVGAADDLAALEAEVLVLRAELGEAVRWPAGLALAVAAIGWLEQRKDALARSEARPFANLLNELEGVLDLAVDSSPLVPMEDDCPEALESLRRAEQELRASVANGTSGEDGYLLEEDELNAIRAVATGSGSDLMAAILAVASVRAAVDRLARAHARGAQPEGVEPPPVPRARALTYLREATRLENDLNDQVQQAVLRGDYLLAKAATRSGHKLSRSRLGLALLGDLPVTGRHELSSGEPDAVRGERERDEERLRGELEVARIMRDALLGDSRPTQPVLPAPVEAAPGRSGALRGSAGATAARSRPQPTPEQLARRRQLPLFIVFGLVAVLTLGYHGAGWLSRKPVTPDISPLQFAHSAPVERVAPINGTLMVVATITWDGATDAEREKYVKGLWTDARHQGYHRMVVLKSDKERPLAVASEGSVHLLPVAGDLKYFAEQQRQGAAR